MTWPARAKKDRQETSQGDQALEIVDYHPNLLADVAGLYAEATRLVPHCFPIEDDELGAYLAGECGCEFDDGPLRVQATKVAVREAGYRHAAISTAWDNYRAFLFYTNYGFRVADWTYELGRDLGE